MSHKYIYTLKLENNKYYVGETTNPQFRLENHFSGNGSAWTKTHKPIKIMEIIPKTNDFDENKYTLDYMKKYGKDNVRGGSFCEIKLNKNNSETIDRMIKGASNACFKCGLTGHYYNQCRGTKKKPRKNYCERCGRDNHTEDNCYAKTDKDGYMLTDSEDEGDESSESEYGSEESYDDN